MALKKDRKKDILEKNKQKIEKIREASPMVGFDSSNEDSLWRNITSESKRDLSPLTQTRMQEIAFYLYDSNPLAHRIIELTKDFVVGDGFKFKAKDKKVQEILDEFWEDSDNNWDFKQDIKVRELSLWGEQCYPVFVNKHNGKVKLGYLDPGMIARVNTSRKNPEKVTSITYNVAKSGNKTKNLKLVNKDNNPNSDSYDYLSGDCFFFAINKVAWSSRGRSDLLSLSDWIDGYDQFLFARLERAFFLNAFIWDVLCEGMSPAEIKEFAKDLIQPKPGSIRCHNEKIKWEAVTPKLESSDASAEANLFKMQILGGAGFPSHWFGEGANTTRATAMEMGLPTLKKLKSRQRFVKFMITHIFNFVIDQAIVHGRLNKDIDRDFLVIPSPILTKDSRNVALTLDKFVGGLRQATELEWISNETAADTFKTFIGQLGLELKQFEKDDKEYKKAKNNKEKKPNGEEKEEQEEVENEK